MNKQTSLLIAIFMTVTSAYGQQKTTKTVDIDTTNMVFRDTVHNLVFDSIAHNLGEIVPTNENNRLVKYFKYIGTEPILIRRAFTGDPHFICDYPREPLLPNRIYSFTVCFYNQGRQGGFNKIMGFELADGKRISFHFKGKYKPIVRREE